MPCALIIDDDRAFTSAVAGYIELEGFSVATADSLGEAREFLGTTVPDLLLVDLMLPDGNGLELIPELPADSPTRIVVITGHASLDAAIESVRASRVVDFLIKPIDVGRLKACIQAVSEVRPAFPRRGRVRLGRPLRRPRRAGRRVVRHAGFATSGRQGGPHRRDGVAPRRERYR
jgi:DNA-binding NtrC family response regulator